ncbi:hypothetical protein ACVXHM_32570 [Pseudomonas aeruginosa]|jgi:hypothetical protein|uniref:Uncharacterized protein n=1 Tax=Pseudomonas indica TaxID=137658 RepID=A0A1G8TWT1_9PSED|nr:MULTISPECIES: hypothetical protein [Pseudomonas]RUJ25128.1 hypothetical protein IPC380_08190 [Pseudomonas aeruginosa]RUJ43166.1 hypothetical protein IPC369_10160 [Pseudomonas aeruginosa]UCO98135.1 hypothetical protein LF844_26400 [Pseudomonas lalkuanensis]WAG78994.1 hypothetical protein LMK08_27285 [Pseudomonas furukawaii]SDJ45971.1 hypothetical protein SAMN05216186_101497 [Pseudomonas indica]
MKSESFIFDRRLYDLLQQERYVQFTTRDLRDAYANCLPGTSFNLSEVRRYVYEQIRRMLRVGWITQDADRRRRGQVYHLLPVPEGLNLDLVDNGFGSTSKPEDKPLQQQAEDIGHGVPPTSDLDVLEHLESLLKEIRLDFLTSMGETERYKQLLDEMPHLKDRVEGDYLDARDRSSRLLGHLRAVEKTLKTFVPKQ